MVEGDCLELGKVCAPIVKQSFIHIKQLVIRYKNND